MIIDCHTHFYDPTRPQGVPWPRPGGSLYRPVLPEHYKALAIPEGVTGTVVVEASPWVEDNQWLLDLAAAEPFIVGCVGHLTPGDAEFGRHLARFARNPLYRGIRVGSTTCRELERESVLADLEDLAARDLSLDLMVDPATAAEVAGLARRIPGLRIVLNHGAGVRVDGKTPAGPWREAIGRMAAQANVCCKVSGLMELTGQQPAPTDLEHYVPALDALWGLFGADRLIYGSNWPVCERATDYAAAQRIVSEYFQGKGADALAKCMWRNAKMAYKWLQRSG